MTGFDSRRPGWARQWPRTLANAARSGAMLARLALPQACALCAGAAADALVCGACDLALPRIDEACPRCAVPSPGAATCGACLASPPPFATAHAAFAYAFPVSRLLQRLKYGGALALADWAAHAMVEELVRRHEPPALRRAVVALPLSRERQRERGFNQAHEIARRVAAALELPQTAALERVQGGPPQTSLPWRGRARNVRGAFACRDPVAGLHLALVDDVMTTGATLREASRTLLAAGAASVAVWVVARTLAPDEA